MRDWLSRIDKDSKDARNKRIFEMWMACHTMEEIAEACNVSKMEVSRTCNESAELPEGYKPSANHLTDFDIPLYNIWKQQTKSNEVAHFGNTDGRARACRCQKARAHSERGPQVLATQSAVSALVRALARALASALARAFVQSAQNISHRHIRAAQSPQPISPVISSIL